MFIPLNGTMVYFFLLLDSYASFFNVSLLYHMSELRYKAHNVGIFSHNLTKTSWKFGDILIYSFAVEYLENSTTEYNVLRPKSKDYDKMKLILIVESIKIWNYL